MIFYYLLYAHSAQFVSLFHVILQQKKQKPCITQVIHGFCLIWQAAPIKISAVFLVFSMVSAFWGKVFGVCCFILLVAAVQPKKILWDLWNLVRSARFCQRSASLQRSCFARFRSYIFITCKYFLQNLRICLQTLYRVTLAFPSVFNGF